jgi:hypothetical protein
MCGVHTVCLSTQTNGEYIARRGFRSSLDLTFGSACAALQSALEERDDEARRLVSEFEKAHKQVARAAAGCAADAGEKVRRGPLLRAPHAYVRFHDPPGVVA